MHIIDARIIVLKKNMSEFLFNKIVALRNRGEALDFWRKAWDWNK